MMDIPDYSNGVTKLLNGLNVQRASGPDGLMVSTWVGSESPCRAELPSADLHGLFFQIHPR